MMIQDRAAAWVRTPAGALLTALALSVLLSMLGLTLLSDVVGWSACAAVGVAWLRRRQTRRR